MQENVVLPEDEAHPEYDAEVLERLGLLRDSARHYVDRASALKRARALRGTDPGYDRSVWAQLSDLGWLGTSVPEAFGGSGLGCAEMAVVAEVLSTGLYPEPFTASAVFAGGCIAHGENDALKRELLPQLIAGQLVPAVAYREASGQDPFDVSTRARPTVGGVTLDGTKRIVLPAFSDGLLVTAEDSEGFAIYWVPAADIPGAMSTRRLPDGRAAADVVLNGVQVPSGHCVARGDAARLAFNRAYDDALVVTSAELIGVSTAVLDLTLDYLRTRVQFGRHIGSFQALQHRAVDLYIQLRMCRHALDEVLAMFQQPDLSPAKRSAQASRVKARCSDASMLISREAVQMHGAMGYSDECDVGLYMNRAITLSSWLGGAESHRRRFGQLALNLSCLAPRRL